MKSLIDNISGAISLKQDAKEHLSKISKQRFVSKGETLIDQGQLVTKTFFVNDGCLRAYCIDKSGKEHTLQFAVGGWWISDFMAIYNEELAALTIESVTDSDVIEFQAKDLEEIFSLFPEFEVFQRKNLERHVVSLHKRILNQLQLSASERYDLFLNQYPDVEQYVPNYHIASYLGVTQQSLSRIRIERVKK